MSPLPDPHAQQAVASPLPPQFLSRLLGTETGDDFAKRVSPIVDQLSAGLARAPGSLPVPPARLGSYFIGPPLGRGGMGAVYRGVHETTGKVVAIKTAPAGTEVGRFLHSEALALGGLDHRGVVQIFDHGEQDGVVWLAMQLVRGDTLHKKIQKQWPTAGAKNSTDGKRTLLSRDEMRVFLGWFKDFAVALAAIHARGVVHRDVKPANLMIADDGTPYVIDFGLSLDGPDNAVVDTLAGTVPYMSPEQVLALTRLDGRTDIYSLAACLFELLSGRRLVQDDEARIGLLRQVAFTPAPKLSSIAPWVDRACDGVLAKALAKDPADRYRSATEFAADIDCLIAGREPRHARTSWTARFQRHRVAIALVVVVAVAGGFLGSRWLRRHQDMTGFRDAAAHAAARGDGGADETIVVLSRALDLAPTYGDSTDFQDVYGRALAEFAPRITKRLFQRAALVPSHVVGATPAGAIGAMAKRHLKTAKHLTPEVRQELVVHAMFVDVLAGQYDAVLAMRASAGETRDERIGQLGAVANVLSGREADPGALKQILEAEFSNLGVDKLSCRAILLLELSGRSETPMTVELTSLSRQLEESIRDAGAERDARNFLAGLASLTHLRLHDPAAAEDILIGRLSDSRTGPADEERPVLVVLAAAAKFRRLVTEDTYKPAAMSAVVERFLSAIDTEPGLATRFAQELSLDPGAAGGGTPAFHRVSADFFDALVGQRPSVAAYCDSLLWLLQHATQDWCRRQDCEKLDLEPQQWETLLRVAESIARESERARFDTLEEGSQYRWLFSTAIHIAGSVPFLAGRDREKNLGRCVEFRDAAVRLLPAPLDEIELAFAGVELRAHPNDEGRRTRFRERKAIVEAAIRAAESRSEDSASLDLLRAEFEEAAKLEAGLSGAGQ